ncbi:MULTISPECIES: hypothetical protein [unclassified Streptomyces]|uniref:hypothetical protein n=1 Tax=unclassified Streptomyces TaxID=2593676 RepID=UPI0029A1A547|nr:MULTISPECIES: hypothetical protein [unclassified Streptomyces]MDX3769460.1 hypothetical protein [Streptomyces sp. AK08-01B]MDX3819691.1 hypothetical protein [Streptomyces sp. AK08-01A]
MTAHVLSGVGRDDLVGDGAPPPGKHGPVPIRLGQPLAPQVDDRPLHVDPVGQRAPHGFARRAYSRAGQGESKLPRPAVTGPVRTVGEDAVALPAHRLPVRRARPRLDGCTTWGHHRPPGLEPLKRIDEVRFGPGPPNTFDLG